MIAESRPCNLSPLACSGGRPSSVIAERTANRGPAKIVFAVPGWPGPVDRFCFLLAVQSVGCRERVFQFLLGVTIYFIDRPGGLLMIRNMAYYVRT